MTSTTFRRGVVAALLVILHSGCREQSVSATSSFTFEAAPRTTQELIPEMARLVPPSAAGIVQVPHPGDLRAELQKVTRAIAPGAEKLVDLVEMVGKLGLRARDLDLARPGAVVLDMGFGPAPIFVLPMRDVAEAADLVDAEAAISGDYLGIALGMSEPPAVGRRAPNIAVALPDGDLALRVDLLKALNPFREMIRGALNPESLVRRGGQAPDPTALKSMSIMFDGIKGLLGTARILDVGLRLRGGSLDADVVLQVAKGSSWDQRQARPSAELVHLARSLALDDASLVFLSTPVWSKWMDAYQPFYQDLANRMGPDQGRAFADMMNRTREIYGMLEVGVASALRFSAQGLHGTLLTVSGDPDALAKGVVQQLDEYNRFLDRKDPSARPTPGPQQQEIAGVEFTGVAMRLDPTAAPQTAQSPGLPPAARQLVEDLQAAVLGGESVRVKVGTLGKHVLGVTGDAPGTAAALVASVRDGKRPRIAMLETVLAQLHATPEFLLACDVRKTLSGIRAGMSDEARQRLKPVPDGDPVLVWVAFSSAGTRYQVQFHIDLLPLMQLVRSLN